MSVHGFELYVAVAVYGDVNFAFALVVAPRAALIGDDGAPSGCVTAEGFAIANISEFDFASIRHGDGKGAVVLFRGLSAAHGDVVADGLVVLVV